MPHPTEQEPRRQATEQALVAGKVAGNRAFLRMSTFSQVSSWKIFFFFVIYKQVRKLLPDPKRALLGSSVLGSRGLLDHRA